MAIGQNSTLDASPAREFAVQTAIVIFAVTLAALLVTQSAFLVVAACLLFVVLAVLKFDWLVYTAVFFLPWNPLLGAKMPVRDISLLLHLALLVGVGIGLIRKGKSVTHWLLGGRIRKTVIIFLTVAVVSLLFSKFHENAGAYRSLARLFSYVAVFFAVIGWLETPAQTARIVKVMLWSTVVVALFGLYQALSDGFTDLYFRMYPLQEEGLEAWNGRVTSFLFHFNFLAGYLNLVIPFAVGAVVLWKDRWMFCLGTICLGTAGATLFLTGSRGGMLAYVGVLLVTVCFLTPRRATMMRILPGLVLSGALVAALVRPQATLRVLEVDAFTQVSRLALWAAAGTMFVDHPLLGVGYGNYATLYSQYVPGSWDQIDSHSLYLQFLAETGMIGFALFFVLIVAFVWIAFKLLKRADTASRLVGIGLAGAITGLLIHGAVDYLFNGSPQFGAMFWLILALGLVTHEADVGGLIMETKSMATARWTNS